MSDATSDSTAPENRRRHPRIPGPFDGRRFDLWTVPLRIYDLSLGGCLIESLHEPGPGQRFTLQIDLPGEGWIDVQVESLYVREGYGFAARFLEMTDDARMRLERVLARLGTAPTER